MVQHADIDHTGVTGAGAAAHIADATDAHDASAISFTPAGSIAATDVQAAIEEVASEAGGSTATLESGRVTRTSGDVTTSSTTFADITGASITFTTGARRVLLNFTCGAYVNNAAGTAGFDFDIDGSRVSGADFGLTGFNQHSTGTEAYPVHMHFLTDALSAGSHTFKVQFRVFSGAHTLTVEGNTTSRAYTFSAVELYAD